MRRYWIRISLGALAIFALGMILLKAGKSGISHVRELAMNHTVSLPGDIAPFRVDNQRLGLVRDVSISRSPDEGFPLVNLTVIADSATDLSSLENCVLVARDADQIRNEGGLSCGDQTMRDAGNLREVGHVTFDPSGQEFSIFSPVGDQNVALTRVPQPSPRGESLKLSADQAGAFVEVRDKNGRPVFQLNADSNGASLSVRDSNGKEVVRFHADSNQVRGHLHQQ